MSEWIAFEDKEPEDETAHYWIGRHGYAPSGPVHFNLLNDRRLSGWTHYMVISCPRTQPPKPRPSLPRGWAWRSVVQGSAAVTTPLGSAICCDNEKVWWAYRISPVEAVPLTVINALQEAASNA